MRPTSNIFQLAVCLSALAPLATAWPSWFPNADSVVVRRVVPEDCMSALRIIFGPLFTDTMQ